MNRRIGHEEIRRDLERLGVTAGDVLLVHSSRRAIGDVDGGAATVVAALSEALGSSGTLVVPTFTPSIRDPHPDVPAAAGDARVAHARDAVEEFDASTTPSEMGAISQSVLDLPDRRRSTHPQVSVAAAGPLAGWVCQGPQPFGYALRSESALGHVAEADGRILLLGVGHNRSSILQHAETLARPPELRRAKVRRFPYRVSGERVWLEVPDVGDDNDTWFPRVGRDFGARSTTLRSSPVGEAPASLFTSSEYIEFAVAALAEHLHGDLPTPQTAMVSESTMPNPVGGHADVAGSGAV